MIIPAASPVFQAMLTRLCEQEKVITAHEEEIFILILDAARKHHVNPKNYRIKLKLNVEACSICVPQLIEKLQNL